MKRPIAFSQSRNTNEESNELCDVDKQSEIVSEKWYRSIIVRASEMEENRRNYSSNSFPISRHI